MHCNVYPIFVKFVRLTHSNKELLTYLLTYLLKFDAQSIALHTTHGGPIKCGLS